MPQDGAWQWYRRLIDPFDTRLSGEVQPGWLTEGTDELPILTPRPDPSDGHAVKAVAASEEHPPSRPSWVCATCGEDWPCPPAKTVLAEEYGVERVSLAVYMATQLGHATSEIATATASELYLRFIEWTRPSWAAP